MEQLYEYLVLYKIGGAGDKEVWHPGSKIRLNAERAAAHLAAGNIRVIETTKLPPEPEPTTVVHEAEPATETVGLAVTEESPKRAKGKGD